MIFSNQDFDFVKSQLIPYIPKDILQIILLYCHVGNREKEILNFLIGESFLLCIDYYYQFFYILPNIFPNHNNSIVTIFIGKKDVITEKVEYFQDEEITFGDLWKALAQDNPIIYCDNDEDYHSPELRELIKKKICFVFLLKEEKN